jgi:ferredoxin
MEGHMKYLADTASLEFFDDRCTGCGVFALKDKKAFILDRDRCMECGACAGNCAFGALRVDKGVGCAAAVINGMISGGQPSCDCGGENKKGDCC